MMPAGKTDCIFKGKTKDQSFLTGQLELMTGFEPVTSSLPKGRNPLKCKVFNEIYNGTNEGIYVIKVPLKQALLIGKRCLLFSRRSVTVIEENAVSFNYWASFNKYLTIFYNYLIFSYDMMCICYNYATYILPVSSGYA